MAAALRVFYTLRPLVPRRLQLALRRACVPLQRSRGFPAWPIEPVLVDAQYEHLRDRLRGRDDALAFVNFWPNAKRFAFILSHDVESARGVEEVPRLLEIEQRHGLTSSWNFCAEQYPIPDALFNDLRAAGCEIGLHGIRHDGRLFSSRASFESHLPRIHRYLSDWHADGFRSPATHRRADWMPELRCLYDSSFPDTDPFEPMAGGCCSIFPFFIEELVELPITLVQDHTWFTILGGRSIAPWVSKSEWIIRHHGLVNLLVHPDYMLSRERLELYDAFLGFLTEQQGGWHALPAEVAQWWKTRAALDVETLAPPGPAADPASLEPTLALAGNDGGQILFDLTAAGERHARFARDGGPMGGRAGHRSRLAE
jgi:peptidoglycan/xylan/chitin deacetylase (PgdA/CDA1 family)